MRGFASMRAIVGILVIAQTAKGRMNKEGRYLSTWLIRCCRDIMLNKQISIRTIKIYAFDFRFNYS